MNSLKEKVIIIAGASGGMGQTICRHLAQEGARMVLGSVDEAPLKLLQAELDELGADAVYMVFDGTVEESTREFFEMAQNKYGKADIMLNLAGLSIPAPISEMDTADYDLTVDVNVKTSFLCAKYFAPLAAENDGLIINIGSMAAKRPNANAPIYCMAKAAVNVFSQGLALQLKEKNIRVTTINPGGTDTGFWGDRKVPREKFLKPEDIAEVILFVMKSNSRMVFHDISFESFLA